MKKWLALDAFRHLGANTSDRYAWSAQSDDSATTVLTLWEDEVEDDGTSVIANFIGHPKLSTWVKQRGNIGRRRHLEHVWNHSREFKVVMLRARDIKAIPRTAVARWPEEQLTMTLLEFNSDTGEFRAEGSRSTSPSGESGTVWLDHELDGCVRAYRELWVAQERGETLNKSALRRKTVADFLPKRREGAYERRMQNISAVIQDLGLPIVRGYLPLKNVGAAKPRIIELINKHWQRKTSLEGATANQEALQTRVDSARQKIKVWMTPPPGSRAVSRVSGTSRSFVRDPNVIAWVLETAAGVCEACNAPAPFIRSDGEPYLEVHHVRPLGEGGPDTVDNAIAGCPNCHRQLHFGEDKEAMRHATIAKVARLIDHPKKRIVGE